MPGRISFVVETLRGENVLRLLRRKYTSIKTTSTRISRTAPAAPAAMGTIEPDDSCDSAVFVGGGVVPRLAEGLLPVCAGEETGDEADCGDVERLAVCVA